MNFHETLNERNAEYAASGFAPDLKMLPSRRTMIVGCVDPALLETLAILGTVSRAATPGKPRPRFTWRQARPASTNAARKSQPAP
ncbi:hypothetical protein AWB74_07634 [Caballeronia arvi]|uniref:Uncharacterized protein n=1 Tax=Caballeronia arvi TaxID=1777135 RepID=A0A158L089_9BURK|nr:hypothetical protein [Caballeronia arvi]SAL86270.1 hypothetical protein AWB74_07634 [Caballeronia arvi]